MNKLENYQKRFQKELFSIIDEVFSNEKDKQKALLMAPLLGKVFKEIIEEIGKKRITAEVKIDKIDWTKSNQDIIKEIKKYFNN